MKAWRVSLLSICLLVACGSPRFRNTLDIQRAVDEGGTVFFSEGTYLLTQTIVITKSNTVIQGAGPQTVFIFKPTLPQVHCSNDRAFTTACDVGDTRRRQITSSIAAGDTSFSVADDISDLHAGDWLIVQEKDRQPGEIVIVDWVQVASTADNQVIVQNPFRTAFPNIRKWDPDRSGLGFFKVPQLIEGIQFRNFTLVVPDSGQGAPGISVFGTKHTLIQDVAVQDTNGQALYSYMAKDLTISHSYGCSGRILNEFAATVDLKLNQNTFSSDGGAGLGLDYGTAFFQVSGNQIPSSVDVGLYALAGVHDGTISGNSISFVRSSGNAIGILARGTSNVRIIDNYLAAGAGEGSMGISIGPDYFLASPITSHSNVISPNSFGQHWAVDYDPTNSP
jgi:hypothetical protein